MRATTDIVEEADSSNAQRASPDCMMSHALLCNVHILDFSLSAESRVGEALDVRIESGHITEIGEGLASGGATVHEGNGGYLAPGLWDEQVHLSQWVLGSQRINTGGGVREIVEGMTADLILLEENPLEFTGSSREVFERLTAVRPLATFLEGELVAER